jgi:hypothetical protein
MKTKLLFLATIFTTVSFLKASDQITYQWDYVNTLQNEWLQKICTQGLDTVYIVGRNGLIAKSTDRASTWNKQYPVNTQLNDIVFCNHTTGFAIGNNGTILRTTDAGLNWEKQSSGVTVNLNAIVATGTDNIWAVGDSGKVIYSTNAGVTWQKKDFSVSTKLNDVSFRNNEGYIVGDAHVCFFTSDKGINWNNKDIAINLNKPDQTALSSINQTTSHTCILIGYNDFMGSSINVDNNKIIQLPYAYTPIKSFIMKNDSIGYGLNIGCAVGCYIAIPSYDINNLNLNQSYSIGISSYINADHLDMNFVNDTIGYFVAGSLLYQQKKYISVGPQGLNNVINKKLSIENNSTELNIQFEDTKVEKIELYGITGLKILYENVNTNETSISLNIENLSKGTYIIRAYYRDNTSTNIKWIKQ